MSSIAPAECPVMEGVDCFGRALLEAADCSLQNRDVEREITDSYLQTDLSAIDFCLHWLWCANEANEHYSPA
jgi:hypothetical protein